MGENLGVNTILEIEYMRLFFLRVFSPERLIYQNYKICKITKLEELLEYLMSLLTLIFLILYRKALSLLL